MGAAGMTIQQWCPWCGNHMGWGGWGMMLLWGVILVLVVAGVLWATRGRDPDRRWSDGKDRAEAILREQYARGDIDEETYRRRLNELRRP